MKRFVYEAYHMHGTTVTKVYAEIPQEAADAIATEEGWDGCHWDNPRLIYVEQVEGDCPSKEAEIIISSLNAVDMADDYMECDND